MPMRATTVRFSEALWTLLEREAAREGVSAAQFIRDATVLRTAYAMGLRGDPGFEAALDRARGRPETTFGNGDDAETRRKAPLEAAAPAEDPERLEALHTAGLLDSDISPEF